MKTESEQERQELNNNQFKKSEDKIETQVKKQADYFGNCIKKVIKVIVISAFIIILIYTFITFNNVGISNSAKPSNYSPEVINLKSENHRIMSKNYKASQKKPIRIRLYKQYSFCLLFLQPQNKIIFNKQLGSILSQAYQNYKAIFYLSNKLIQSFIQKNNLNEKILILQTFKNTGKNIYDGVVNQCPEQSMIVLLKNSEVLAGPNVLNQIYLEQIKKPAYLIASPILFNNIKLTPDKKIYSFSRENFFPLNHRNTDLSLIDNITSHVRIFNKSEYFKISFIVLLHQNQTFIQSEISHLLPLIELRKRTFSLRESNITLLKTTQLPKPNNPDEVHLVGHRSRQISEQQIIQLMNYYPLKSQPPFWKESRKLNLLKRNISKTQKLIPALIHQIWVGSQIPQFKKKFMSKFHQIMPNYTYRLWGEKDITEENFPLTYNYIIKLKEIQKTSQYSKQSMIADLMKFQIIYNHGGFYFDTNYQLIKSFENFRYYPIVVALEQSETLGVWPATALFAAEKGSKYLKKLLQEKNLKAINLTSHDAHFQSGPFFFGKAFTLQDYYYSIKVVSPQIILPTMFWLGDQRVRRSLCTYNQLKDIPESIKQTYKEIIAVKGKYVIFPCNNQYPDCYGVNHFDLGSTWKNKTTSTGSK